MTHIKKYNQYNEGLINYVRYRRFPDDDIVQNLIKILQNTDRKNLSISHINSFIENQLFRIFSLGAFEVKIPKENIEFKIEFYDSKHRYKMAEYSGVYIEIDGLTLSTADKKISSGNARKLYHLVDKLYAEDVDNVDDLLVKSTIRKTLDIKANKNKK